MKRLTAIVLGVFCFVLLLSSSADAGLLSRVKERRASVTRKVERKVEVKKEAHFRLLPSRCAGGQCPVK